jgi:hypothetical protein
MGSFITKALLPWKPFVIQIGRVILIPIILQLDLEYFLVHVLCLDVPRNNL